MSASMRIRFEGRKDQGLHRKFGPVMHQAHDSAPARPGTEPGVTSTPTRWRRSPPDAEPGSCDRRAQQAPTAKGTSVALTDACRHGLFPLSKGRFDGDNMVCGHHSVAYGPNGRCTRMPAQQTLNLSAAVTAHPVVGRRPLRLDPAR
ncbi:Rieske 2Fe-2S domain-containing protein [Streptomyces canus]|uniref:Rieske 2Fe-2S domain-containing protein n=1 Tax=Streptomyces canus TaxID=58343 RepID=UPI003689450D